MKLLKNASRIDLAVLQCIPANVMWGETRTKTLRNISLGSSVTSCYQSHGAVPVLIHVGWLKASKWLIRDAFFSSFFCFTLGSRVHAMTLYWFSKLIFESMQVIEKIEFLLASPCALNLSFSRFLVACQIFGGKKLPLETSCRRWVISLAP